MAIVLKIGPTTDFYDLTDRTTAGHLYVRLGGIRDTYEADGHWIETYELAAFSSTHTAIVNYEEDIQDHLTNAALYANDKQQSTPIWLYESADSETGKRAVVLGGSLKPIMEQNNSRLMERNKTFYILTVNRGPWEPASATTAIDAQTLDGVTNTYALSSIKGDVPGRISKILFRGTATNDEDAPITKVIAGIRREYGGVSLFDPVLDVEMAGTLENETTVFGIDDSNTYPNGSSDANVLKVAFADTVYERRAVISLLDAFAVTNLVTNGDAETGDLTGWTEEYPGWAADSDYANTGTYGFYSSVVNDNDWIKQDIAVTAGYTYILEYTYQVYAVTVGVMTVGIGYYDSDSDAIANSGIYRRYQTVTGDFDTAQIVTVAPSNASFIRVEVINSAPVGNSISCAIDDINLYAVPFDHYRGRYDVYARAKLSAAGDADIETHYGYTGSSQLVPMGGPQKVSNTDWKLIPMGTCNFPPGRALADVESAWRMSNLGFEIYAQKITGTISLYIDALILIPTDHKLYVDGCSICRSSYTIDAAATTYAYADLDVRKSELDELVVYADSQDFTGINVGLTASAPGWIIPNDDGVLVAFFERSSIHTIADDVVVTMEYLPRYVSRNTD